MPGPYPQEFREDVIAVARRRESGVTIKQIATDFGVSEATLQNWLRQADVEEGNRPGQTAAEAAEVRELLTALTEVPHFCSLKIPTLGRSAA